MHNIGPITLGTNATPLPGNSQHTYVVDSTRFNDGGWTAGAAAAAPGKNRGVLGGSRIAGTILPTGQAVTVIYELLTDYDGTTAAAFEQDTNGPGGGSQVVAAGTTQPFSWLPHAVDYRIRILAGATAPTTLKTTCQIVWDRSAGV